MSRELNNLPLSIRKTSKDTPLSFELIRQSSFFRRPGKNPNGKEAPIAPGLFLMGYHRGELSIHNTLQHLQSQLSSLSPSFSIFISDEGSLYPPSLQKWKIPLTQVILVKTASAVHAWRAALESLQSGLFRWVFLRPSGQCSPAHLRKMQLEAEKVGSSVFLFSKTELPHWVLKRFTSLYGQSDSEKTDPVS